MEEIKFWELPDEEQGDLVDSIICYLSAGCTEIECRNRCEDCALSTCIKDFFRKLEVEEDYKTWAEYIKVANYCATH